MTINELDKKLTDSLTEYSETVRSMYEVYFSNSFSVLNFMTHHQLFKRFL